tara:strand:+ start:183333 stop:186257 length:2925 start_codon:yes stop_codon:yes gene_type:complete
MRFLLAWGVALIIALPAVAQETATPNGIADNRNNALALTGGNVYLPDGRLLESGTVLLREGRIVDVVAGTDVPAGYFAVDMAGKYIYPGLVDMYTGYGLPDPARPASGGGAEVVQSSGQAYNANDAIRAHYRAVMEFRPDTKRAAELRRSGFSAVLSLHADGIARGTSALVTLGNENANEAVVLPDAAAHYSLKKGSSRQTVPVSLMGSVALLRQTYLDAQWFGQQNPRPFAEESLEGWIRSQSLPQVMEVDNWHQALTVNDVADEFEKQYVIRVANDAYQQAAELAATGATLIVPVDYPEAPEVADPFVADEVSFADLKHWELAPFNLRLLHEQGVGFAITSAGSGDKFWDNLRVAVKNGLPADAAIAALTTVPARILGVEDRIGSLQEGSLANLLVTSAPLFEEGARLLENWVRGDRFVLASDVDERRGQYDLRAGQQQLVLALDFKNGKPGASILDGSTGEPAEGSRVTVDISENIINLNFSAGEDSSTTRLSGWSIENGWQGTGQTPTGESIDWRMTFTGPLVVAEEESPAQQMASEPVSLPSPVLFPFAAYGSETLPSAQDTLIRNATVWTNEDMGTVVTDVLISDGRIAAVGENLTARNALEVDGTGKHLTPGIIDEHTHIALFSINEIATNSSMVRMRDVVNSQDVNIYRNLAGGVVAAQQLHGSSNPIGGQSSMIKLRWGMPPEGLLIDDAPKFIKFALGENVKRSTNPASIRYPQTRMGVEQVYFNAFSQAQEYEQRWNAYNSLSGAQRRNAVMPRRDLVDETMLEIMKGERFVTNHSYVQSEINMMMHMAESFGFNINTFTHILEGYKVADKMAAHGAGGSTFSDWWAFKWEVRYAIPYNAALMQMAGVVVALNSDDAEMSRRLNQEAGKMVKYGNVSEVDALKMITLNPAKLMHLDHRMGSIRVGKDADLVLWDEHPLSVYAQAQTTWVDGIPYFDRARDRDLRQQISDERARIIAAITSGQE